MTATLISSMLMDDMTAFSSFSVATHSLTRFTFKSPVIVALVRWCDMTFSKSIQDTSRCMDLSHSYLNGE
ncbi:hypothetical protein Ahy_B06g082561 isoform D [Arachis hypogaea]|uniref:Uncharacterized protein n=1 Tax=Arachis hypogaea TaxID=3818 RepID=A0A444YNR3_ARAHY|nr:hypothetical protein Ahy_B06g082561 isoform D [Arachis hypogaea]